MINLKKYNNEFRIYRTMGRRRIYKISTPYNTLTSYWIDDCKNRWDFQRGGSILSLYFINLKD